MVRIGAALSLYLSFGHHTDKIPCEQTGEIVHTIIEKNDFVRQNCTHVFNYGYSLGSKRYNDIFFINHLFVSSVMAAHLLLQCIISPSVQNDERATIENVY